MNLVTPNIGLLFWMLVSFGIILFILTKFAWKPILQMLKERESSIEDALNSAKKAKEEMSKLQADNERIIAEAKLERDKMLKEARTIKDNIINEAKLQASVEGNKMIEAARLTIETEKNAALTEIKNQVASLSISIAEKILKHELQKDKKQDELISQTLQEVGLN